jgi:hypothetical protein
MVMRQAEMIGRLSDNHELIFLLFPLQNENCSFRLLSDAIGISYPSL